LSLDEDMDELEEELKALLDESKPDSISGLPTVPTNSLRSAGEPILGSLPAVPQSRLTVTTEQLEAELNNLTLSDTGLHVLISQFSSLCQAVIYIF